MSGESHTLPAFTTQLGFGNENGIFQIPQTDKFEFPRVLFRKFEFDILDTTTECIS